MAELGTGWVSIVPDVSKLTPGIRAALDKAEPEFARAGGRAGKSFMGSFNPVAKIGAAAAGIASGVSFAGAFAKGFGRLKSIDTAEAKLRGLGHTTASIQSIMDSALKSVKGTAFALDEAVTTAASLSASGIKPGEQLTTTLKTVADTAAIAGTSMADMGVIFGSVAARGKLQGDDLLQLTSRGVPAIQMIAQATGKTSQELSQMMSKGQLTFDMFERGMREGLGGAALAYGDTFVGAFSNMVTASARLTADLLEPWYDQAVPLFKAVTGGIDDVAGALKPVNEQIAALLAHQIMPDFWAWVRSDEVKAAGHEVAQLGGLLMDTASAVAPSVSKVAVALGDVAEVAGGAAWGVFSGGLTAGAEALRALTPLLDGVGSLLGRYPELFGAIAAGLLVFRTVPKTLEPVTQSVEKLTGKLTQRGKGGAAASVSEMADAAGGLAGAADTAARGADTVTKHTVTMADGVTAGAKTLKAAGGEVAATGAKIGGVGTKITSGLKSAGSALMGFAGGPVGLAVTGLTLGVAAYGNWVAMLDGYQRDVTKSAKDAAKAQAEFTASVAGTTGALTGQQLELGAGFVADYTSGMVAAFENAGYFTKHGLNLLAAFSEDTARLQSNAEMGQQVADVLQDMGRDLGDLNSIIAAGGAPFDQLVTRLQNSGWEGERAAKRLLEARDSFDELQAGARNIEPALAAAAEQLSTMADASSTIKDRAGALGKVLQGMGMAPTDAETQRFATAKQAQQQTEQIRQQENVFQSGALFDAQGRINADTKAGQELFKQYSDLSSMFLQAIEGADGVNGAISQIETPLNALRDAAGLTEEQFQQLNRQFGLMPDSYSFLLNIQGYTETSQQLLGIQAQLTTVGRDHTINIGAATDDVVERLKLLGLEVDASEPLAVKVTARTDEAVTRIGELAADIDGLNLQQAAVAISLDTEPLKFGEREATQILEALNATDVAPGVSLQLDRFRADHETTLADLAEISRVTATPMAALYTEVLDRQIVDVDGKLAKLASTPVKIPLSFDSQEFAASVANLYAQLGLAQLAPGVYSGYLKGVAGKNRDRRAANSVVTGNIPLGYGGRNYAAGSEDHRAEIAGPGEWRVWAEPETGGEAYIPLAESKRGRSTEILSAVARRFGKRLVDSGTRMFADGGVIGSIRKILGKKFPNMVVTSDYRAGDPGYHGRHMAVDFAPSDGTTGTAMNRAAWYFAEQYGRELLELIHSPFEMNIKNGKDVGDGVAVYGAATMAQHENHVHVAADHALALDPKVSEAGASERSERAVGAGVSSPDVRVDFGSASDIYRSVSKRMGVPERQDVRADTSSSGSGVEVTPYVAGSGGWGHEFFVSEITRAAKQRGLPERAAVTGVATGLVESGNPMLMYANKAVPESLTFRHDAIGSDHDSVGLFQQRPGWGTVAQRMDPFASASLFYDALVRIPGWEKIPEGVVAQMVQRSAFPQRYMGQIATARGLVEQTRLYDAGGVLPHGGGAVNLSGADEVVFTNSQWGTMSQGLRNLAAIVPGLQVIATSGRDWFEQAATGLSELAKGTSGPQIAAVRGVNQATAGWFRGIDVVDDAEKGLAEVRVQNAADTAALAQGERELTAAREALKQAQADGGDTSAATERVAAAEKNLSGLRGNVAGGVLRLAAGERTLLAAKIKALAALLKHITGAMQGAGSTIKTFADGVTAMSAKLRDAQKDLFKSELEFRQANVATHNAVNEAFIAELGIRDAKVKGLREIADLEDEIHGVKRGYLIRESTAVNQMGEAVGRYLKDGVLAEGTLGARRVYDMTKLMELEGRRSEIMAQTNADMKSASLQAAEAAIQAEQAKLKEARVAEELAAKNALVAKLQTVAVEASEAEEEAYRQYQDANNNIISGIAKTLDGIGEVVLNIFTLGIGRGSVSGGARKIADGAAMADAGRKWMDENQDMVREANRYKAGAGESRMAGALISNILSGGDTDVMKIQMQELQKKGKYWAAQYNDDMARIDKKYGLKEVELEEQHSRVLRAGKLEVEKAERQVTQQQLRNELVQAETPEQKALLGDALGEVSKQLSDIQTRINGNARGVEFKITVDANGDGSVSLNEFTRVIADIERNINGVQRTIDGAARAETSGAKVVASQR